MNITEIRDYLRTAPMDEVKQVAQITSMRIKSERKEAKAQFAPGDRVNSDNPKWIYGPATVTKVLRKYVAVETDGGSRFKVPPTWLKHI